MSNDSFTPISNKYAQQSTKELRLHANSPAGYLTAGAVREWFSDVERVTLAVDREHSRLGISPGDSGAGSSYSLTKCNGNANVAVKTAFREFDIDVDAIEQTWAFELEEDGAYVVADVSQLVEARTDAVHCDVCDKRCTGKGGMKSHRTRAHDNPIEALEETDPDAVGEPFPDGGGTQRGSIADD